MFRVFKATETENRTVTARLWVEEEMSFYLMGIDFQFCKTKSSGHGCL